MVILQQLQHQTHLEIFLSSEVTPSLTPGAWDLAAASLSVHAYLRHAWTFLFHCLQHDVGSALNQQSALSLT